MSRLAIVLVLCCITATACARRTARAVRLPSAAGTSAAERAPGRGDTVKTVRDAIRSLKDRMSNDSGTPGEPGAGADAGAAAGAVPPSAQAPGAAAGVGTSGVWSVENRYPAVAPNAASQGPAPRGRLLSRAGQAVRRAGEESWTGVLALCAIAALVVTVLVRRRSRAET